MARKNRIFPDWKKSKKGDRPPGSYPPKPKVKAGVQGV